MKCQFCPAEAVAVFTLDQGCFCYPDAHEQAYCVQHVLRANPVGSMELKEVLQEDMWRKFAEWQRQKQGAH